MAKAHIRAWIPPALRGIINRAIGANIVYHGPFPSWDAAVASTSGYNEAAILERVVCATSSVLRGEADYEQDGVAFRDTAPASYALSGLLLAAAGSQGRLSVLDFGGGLASNYLRWRPVVGALVEVQWAVVEQPRFVEDGRKLFRGNPAVTFHECIDQVAPSPNAILASSVLQYLPDPHQTLRSLMGIGSSVIVLDRTLYSDDGTECIATQHVPRQLGSASYPVRMLSREKVHEELRQDYALVAEFEASDKPARLGRHVARNLGSIWTRTT